MCGQVSKGWLGVVPVLRVLGVYGPSMSCTCNLLTRSRSVIHSGSKSLDVTARCAGGASGLRKGRTGGHQGKQTGVYGRLAQSGH
jgi:hypothetical protein